MTDCPHKRVSACADRPGAYCRGCAEYVTYFDLTANYEPDLSSSDVERFIKKAEPAEARE